MKNPQNSLGTSVIFLYCDHIYFFPKCITFSKKHDAPLNHSLSRFKILKYIHLVNTKFISLYVHICIFNMSMEVRQFSTNLVLPQSEILKENMSSNGLKLK